MANYIISLANTIRTESFITLWRPNNAGYCFSFEMAGKYDVPEKGYHDSQDNTPIKIQEAEKIAITLSDGRRVIPNTKVVWDILGMKMTKKGLQFKAGKEAVHG